MNNEDRILISFLEDKVFQCRDRQTVTTSKFLNMHEKSLAASLRISKDIFREFYGVFEDSERVIAVFLPEYLTFEEFLKDEELNPLCVLEVTKDKFSNPLSHRDYLGALMGLGINREMLGDIQVTETGCQIVCFKNIADYICKNLDKAGKGTLEIKVLQCGEVDTLSIDEGIEDSFTVSSLRLDSVVKNGFRISRDSACEAISHALVFVNDIECLKPDKKVGVGDKITLRHKGRIIICDIPGKSKRGRDIIKIKKYLR